MGDLSKNFSRWEFKCKCGECEQVGPDPELVVIAQDVRDHFNKPTKITSGHRCPAYNALVGGVKGSQHLKGKAGDLQVEDVPPDQVADYLLAKYEGQKGIGRYNDFTHIDTRPGPHRWDKRR
jgi:uncharacterized protein YcbK (DUF882 family)